MSLNSLLAVVLSLTVVWERAQARLWHGVCPADIVHQRDYLDDPNRWAAWVEKLTKGWFLTFEPNQGRLQRKVRAFGNFVEYTPLVILFLVVLELMQAPSPLLWGLGIAYSVGRMAHAIGVMETYGPSPGRAIGYFLTLLVYLIGAGACLTLGSRFYFS
ncbi:MAPEG family protein [Acaryochloris sp. CCMEE 5410]|uniref:MAPEG family protein n=1 Tax=Acaryochloris sp. CCMEE 5410 TaxID=310037 RepID=UPI00024837B5|nr:MAPEG family protein [Acaryochloris sp. CCMEE 5410]